MTITIRKYVQLNVDSMPRRGSGMTQIPLLPCVRGEGWEQHVAVKSHLDEAEFKQQTFNTEAHSTAPGHLAALILWQISFASCLYSCHCHLQYTRSDNKVHELIAVKMLHTSLLNTTVVAFKVLPLGSYAPIPASSPPFKTILEPTTVYKVRQ